MKKVTSLLLVNYYHNNGDDVTYEVIVKSEADFKKWLKERNKQRISDGEKEQHENEFTLWHINLVKY